MEKELLETFLTIAKVQNISRAADILFVSQATVSHRLKQLEKQLGLELIVRSKGAKRTELTAGGRRILPLVQSWMLADYELENFTQRPSALEIHLGTVNSVNNYLFSGFYKQLRNDPLDWHLKIETTHTQNIYEQIRLNALDIGFPLEEETYPNLHVRKIQSEKLMVVSKYPIHDKKVLMPNDLDVSKQIYINWGSAYRKWHNRFFPPYEMPRYTVDMTAVALELLDEDAWFFAPYSICLMIWKKQNYHISGLGIGTPERNLYMVTEKSMEQAKRYEITLFKHRVMQYMHRWRRDLHEMLREFHVEHQTEYVYYKDFSQ